VEFMEIVRARRSVRRFRSDPVPVEAIMELFEAGRWAPSGGNAQAWVFVVVRQDSALRKLKAVSPGMLGDPTAAIVLCTDTDRIWEGRSTKRSLPGMDTGMAAQNMLLMAQALGLGSCPIASFNPQAVSLLLDLPSSLKPELIISLGYPAGETRAPARRPIEEIAHFESYGREANAD
jgi:nitroreductase